MITKFKSFENSRDNYLYVNISKECLRKMKVTEYSDDSWCISGDEFNLKNDDIIIDENGAIFDFRFTEADYFDFDNVNPQKLTYKLFHAFYKVYDDFDDKIYLTWYNDDFIKHEDYLDILYKKYDGNTKSKEYNIERLHNRFFLQKENYNLYFERIKILIGDDETCLKQFVVKDFNL